MLSEQTTKKIDKIMSDYFKDVNDRKEFHEILHELKINFHRKIRESKKIKEA